MIHNGCDRDRHLDPQIFSKDFFFINTIGSVGPWWRYVLFECSC